MDPKGRTKKIPGARAAGSTSTTRKGQSGQKKVPRKKVQKVQICSDPIKLPEVLEMILPFLDTPNLRTARCVNKLWHSTAGPLISSREQIVQLNGAKQIDEYLQFLERATSTELKSWNLKYDVTFKFTWKLDKILRSLEAIAPKPNSILSLNMYGDYFFRSERYSGLTPEVVTLLGSLCSGLKKLTINNNTLACNDYDGPPLVQLVGVIMSKTPALTHLIFDHSIVWSQFGKHEVYDVILVQSLFIDLANLQHLELLLTDEFPYSILSTFRFRNLTYFKLCLTTHLSPTAIDNLRRFMELGCPELATFEIEAHNREGWQHFQKRPVLVRLPKLREFGQIDKSGAADSNIEGELKRNAFIPIETTRLECLRVNVPVLMVNSASSGIYRRETIRTLVITLDDQCTDDLKPELKSKLEKKLTILARMLRNLRKLTIVIKSLDFDPQVYLEVILAAFAKNKVATLEIKNYYEDFLGTLVTQGHLISSLKGLRELNISPFDPSILTELKKFDEKPKSCRLDLARILPITPNMEIVRLPTRFGFSWIPKEAMLPQTRQNELKDIWAWFPRVEIKFF